MTFTLTDQQARLVLQSLQNESHKYWILSKEWDSKARPTKFKERHEELDKLITHIKEQPSLSQDKN